MQSTTQRWKHEAKQRKELESQRSIVESVNQSKGRRSRQTAEKVVVEVTDLTELETNETELSHTVELNLVYHSMNSSMLGVVAVRYK
ncbi:hypothetical protein HN51_018232 [Arachis hypogaea]